VTDADSGPRPPTGAVSDTGADGDGDDDIDPFGPYVNDAVATGLVVGYLSYLALVGIRGPATVGLDTAPALLLDGWLAAVGIAVAWVFGPETVRAVGMLVAAIRSPDDLPGDTEPGGEPGPDPNLDPVPDPEPGPRRQSAGDRTDDGDPTASPTDGTQDRATAGRTRTDGGEASASAQRRRMIQTQTPGLDAGLGALLSLSLPAAFLIPALPRLGPLPVVTVTPPASRVLANLAAAPTALVLGWVAFAATATVWAFGVRAARSVAALRTGGYPD
jgi:hypothetical protein